MELFLSEQPGPEPAVLFVHGFPFDGRMWEPQVEALRGRVRLLIPDLPGFGRTPIRIRAPSIEGYASSLASLLDEMRIEEVALCGFSMGGYIALAFAALFPERLAGLILADTRVSEDSPEGKAGRTQSAARVLAEGPGFLADSMPDKLMAPPNLRTRPETVERVRRLIREQSREGVAAALLAMRDRPDRTGELPRIACPTLVLCGAEDSLSPPAEMRGMAEAIPGARFFEIPGAGHLSNLENPAEFNRLVSGFLAGG